MSKYLPMCCNEVEMREAAAKICRDFLHGAWKTVSAQDLEFRRISGGLSNFLYYVALPEKVETEVVPDTVPLMRSLSEEEKRNTIGNLLGRSLSRQSSFCQEEPKKVLVRIYGQTQSERGVDNIIMDSVIFTLLSERRLGPKLHGVFSGGRIEEYIAAHTLLTRELSEPALSMKIAEKMAAIHSMDVPLCKEPQWLWKKMAKWLRSALQILESYQCQNENEERCVAKIKEYNLEKEVIWLRGYLSTVDSPVVFCHNDFQEGNILLRDEEVPQNDEANDDVNIDYSAINQDNSSDSFLTKDCHDEDMKSVSGDETVKSFKENNLILANSPSSTNGTRKSSFANGIMDDECVTNDSLCSHISDSSLNNGEPKLVLIDYEYCSYNHRGFDLANHFLEWTYDYTNPEYPYYYEIFDHYPTLEQKEIFMRQYLWKMTGREVSAEQVNQLNSEVEAFTLASHLFWSLWAVVNAAKSQIPFGYWEYGVSRMNCYNSLKVEIIKKDANGGNPLKRKIMDVDI